MLLLMSPMPAPLRALMLLWAIMQIALPPIAAVADSTASAAGLSAHAHVEDRSHGTCVPVHGSDCVLCQYLNGLAAQKGDSPPHLWFAPVPTDAARALIASRAVELRGLVVPRGPPVSRIG